jgi:hypothetical protein
MTAPPTLNMPAGVTALNVARKTLLVSIAVYAATLALGYLQVGPWELLFLISLASIPVMVLSAVACLLLQITAFFLNPPTR